MLKEQTDEIKEEEGGGREMADEDDGTSKVGKTKPYMNPVEGLENPENRIR